MVNEIAALISIAAALYPIIFGEIGKYKNRQAEYEKLFNDLRKEVANNLKTVEYLIKQDNSVQAVYDPAIRENINSLSFEKQAMASELFETVIGKQLKKYTHKKPLKKDRMRNYWNIKDTARKLEDLNRQMKKIPAKPSGNAPKIILKRRLPALLWRLRELNEALKTGNKGKK